MIDHTHQQLPPHPDIDEVFTAWQERRDPDAATYIIQSFGGLAYNAAKAYNAATELRGGAVDTEDLAIAGCYGLLRAALRFDTSLGNTVSTATYPAIRGSMSREFYRHAHATYIPSHAHPVVRLLDRCVAEGGGPDRLLTLTDTEVEERCAAADPSIPQLSHTPQGTIPPYGVLYNDWNAEPFGTLTELEDRASTPDRHEQLATIAGTPASDMQEDDTPVTAIALGQLIEQAFSPPLPTLNSTPQRFLQYGEAVAKLARQRHALTLRFGLDGREERTYQQIADALNFESAKRAKHKPDQAKRIDRTTAADLVTKALQTLREFAEIHWDK